MLIAAPAAGQDGEGSIRLGPLGLSPSIRVSNVGIDTNVLNDPDTPQQDFTATFNPAMQIWLRAGPSRVRGSVAMSAIYFREFASQRALNTTDEVRWELPLNRFLPYVSYSIGKMRARPNQEIDDRVEYGTTNTGVGTTVRVGARTALVVQAQRGEVTFGSDEEFFGTNLSQALDRTTDTVGSSVRLQLTPLTTFVIAADVQRESFKFSPRRDAMMRGVRPGVEFSRSALITGSAYVGYRTFDIDDPTVPDYSGVTASVDLAYVLLDRTRFSTRIDRDVVYSFSELQPYYVQTGAVFTVTQQLSSTWDVSVGTSRQWQDYQVSTLAVVSGQPAASAPRSTLSEASQYSYQFGVGRRLGRKMRVAFQADHAQRTSGLLGTYRGTRFFNTVSYDF